MMKNWLFKGMLSAVIVLPALSGAAWGGETDDFGCSNATLKGEYAFGVTNYVGNSIVVVAGIEVFDGNGNFTQRDYGGDSVPAEFSPPGQEKGTYQVDPDCTGSMVINLNVPGVPPRHLFRGHTHPVCDQQWRASYPRRRFGIHPARIYWTRVHPN